MIVQDIIDIMESHFPEHLQEEWDKSGFQLGDRKQQVTKIMVGLDADLRTLNEAIEQGCNMLITHHPFLFNKLNLDFDTSTGQFIQKAIMHHVAVYSAHTNLDKVAMNVWLAKATILEHIDVCEEDGLVRKGQLPQVMNRNDFVNYLKKTLHVDVVKVAGVKDNIQSVAVCGGSGSDYIDAVKNQVDAYVTGDLKYHAGMQAYDDDFLLVDVGHHVEVIMVEKLAAILREESSLEVVESTSPDYYQYL